MDEALAEQVEALFVEHFRSFLEWAEKNWSVSGHERHDDIFGQMSDERIEGYNAGIASMRDAFDVWREERTR